MKSTGPAPVHPNQLRISACSAYAIRHGRTAVAHKLRGVHLPWRSSAPCRPPTRPTLQAMATPSPSATPHSQAVKAIEDDRTHGASELARMALESVAAAAQQSTAADCAALTQELDQLAARLQRSRPSMAPIVNLVGLWRDRWREAPTGALAAARTFAQTEADSLIRTSRDAVDEVAKLAAALVGTHKTVMTTSLSSSISKVFALLAAEGSGCRAIITESRPGGEGQILAKQLSQLGTETEYITEAQMGLFVKRADLVLVGADSVLADGAVVNKAGTSLLAYAARVAGTPVYVCCESFKRSKQGSEEVALEEMDPRELGLEAALPHVTAHNIYFDITPAEFISGYVFESGCSHVAAD